jgi:hypothetical protein
VAAAAAARGIVKKGRAWAWRRVRWAWQQAV